MLGPQEIKMSRDETTKISGDGLRYKSKEGGSPFGASASVASMSCYKCGLHKARALGTFKRILNQNMFMCAECKNKT
jgi:hypothetical protein